MSEAFICEVADGVAIIAINRPKVMNAFCGRTCDELIHACNRAGWDKSVGVIVLTGTGDEAFCTGGPWAAPDRHLGYRKEAEA